jgi:DNA-binding transcriptional LysR family regulator
MELMQLEMFIAVVEERSVRKAACRVFRTQPAISIAIKKLEYEMGAPLLDRSRQMDYRPTVIGRRLYDYATRIIGLRNKALSLGQEGLDEAASSTQSEVLTKCAAR